MISAVMARLSVSSPISPRLIQALNASSRKSRRVGELQEWLDARARQRDDVLAVETEVGGGAAGGVAQSDRQSVEIALASSTRRQDCSSFSTFCENCVASVASR